jgi:PAP2 superfamily protein
MRAWLSERHPLAVEAAAIVALYAVYETARGLVAGDEQGAVAHARSLASLERSLHVFVEGDIQHALGAVPGLVGTLGVLYLTLHLTVTCGALLWLHRRRAAAFATVRTALFAASAFALVGYLAFPTAPPRLAGIGVADSISDGALDLNHGLVSALYNPYAAFPSIHVAYASIVGAAVVNYGGSRALRLAGVLYPLLIVLVIVATGNHFFVDAAAGAAAALVSLAAAALLRATTDEGVGLAVPAKA